MNIQKVGEIVALVRSDTLPERVKGALAAAAALQILSKECVDILEKDPRRMLIAERLGSVRGVLSPCLAERLLESSDDDFRCVASLLLSATYRSLAISTLTDLLNRGIPMFVY